MASEGVYARKLRATTNYIMFDRLYRPPNSSAILLCLSYTSTTISNKRWPQEYADA